MIPYRLLPPAEEEMIEAALFYEGEAAGLGDDFLDDVQHAMIGSRRGPSSTSIDTRHTRVCIADVKNELRTLGLLEQANLCNEGVVEYLFLRQQQ